MRFHFFCPGDFRFLILLLGDLGHFLLYFSGQVVASAVELIESLLLLLMNFEDSFGESLALL